MTPAALAAAAESLVGARFRLHGRNPGTGLDCIGLLSAALTRAGASPALPTGYSLRLRDLDQWLPDPATLGFARAVGPCRAGDVVMLQPAAVQFHLAIASNVGWVHAHAGLHRVVLQPDRPGGTLLHHWRLVPPN